MSDEKRVAQALKELCVPASLMGYYYLKSAILICLDNPEAIHSTMKLYPAIATAHSVTDKAVEHAIRHAVAYSVKNAPVVALAKYMAVPANGRVKNSLYIASVAEALRLEEAPDGENQT